MSNQKPMKLAEELANKTIVVDTSSLLSAGTGLLGVIKNCHLIVPTIVVHELKNSIEKESVGSLAREWLNLFEDLRIAHGASLSTGVVIDNDTEIGRSVKADLSLMKADNVTISIEPNHVAQKSLPDSLRDGSNNSTVLAVAQNFKNEIKKDGRDEEIVLLSNDIKMRIDSTLTLKIPAYHFSAANVIGAKPFSGHHKVVLTSEEYADAIHGENNEKKQLPKLAELILERLQKGHAHTAHVSVYLDSDAHEENKVLDAILRGKKLSKLKKKTKASKITARAAEQDVAMEYLKLPAEEATVVSIAGKAGSGKTLVTMAVALDELSAGRYQKVMVLRSLHEMGDGQEMGFLPGDVDDKMAAWAGAVTDALDVIAAAKKPLKKNAGPHGDESQKDEAKRLREMIEVSPITYLRGRSLSNTFIILDEAQNFTRQELLNIISRAGEGSKIVLAFDAAQVDNRFIEAGKNADIWSVIESLKHEDIFAHITLQKTERSRIAEIASRILEG